MPRYRARVVGDRRAIRPLKELPPLTALLAAMSMGCPASPSSTTTATAITTATATANAMTTATANATTTATATANEPPAGLRCIARYYSGRVERRGQAWWLALPDGVAVPWDDARAKDFETKLASPDLEDTLSIPYAGGPIRAVTTENDDPGRIRADAVFRATFGHTRDEVAAELVPWTFRGQTLQVHRRALESFRKLGIRLEEAIRADAAIEPFLRGLGGTFVFRNIAGTTRPSAHSYGISLDINTERSDYWLWQREKSGVRWRNRIPQAIVDVFEAEGFVWGGRWYHYDTMHFELRPELLDASCR